jgi:Flp pilus assembly protein TadD
MEPKFGAAQHTLGLAYAQMGLPEEAIVELSNARICAGDQPAIIASLAYAYAAAERTGEAAATLRELEDLAGRRHVSPCWFALVHAGLGHTERAMEWLDQAYREKDAWLTWLKVEPRFDALRPLPAFQALLGKIGLAG